MTHEALLAGVRESPEEDGPRLVLADWLEDHGEADRAEFIRLQIRIESPAHTRGWQRLNESIQKLLINSSWSPKPGLGTDCVWASTVAGSLRNSVPTR